MTTTRLETYTRKRFGMELSEFIKIKVQKENLYDYEIASALKVSSNRIGKLRKSFRIKKANTFSKRFECTYGTGSLQRFKEIIEDPENSLSDVARYFGFSRENARIVCHKIYGFPCTRIFKRKLQLRRRNSLIDKRPKRRNKEKQYSTKGKGGGANEFTIGSCFTRGCLEEVTTTIPCIGGA